jgi:hypothetical protein
MIADTGIEEMQARPRNPDRQPRDSSAATASESRSIRNTQQWPSAGFATMPDEEPAVAEEQGAA